MTDKKITIAPVQLTRIGDTLFIGSAEEAQRFIDGEPGSGGPGAPPAPEAESDSSDASQKTVQDIIASLQRGEFPTTPRG